VAELRLARDYLARGAAYLEDDARHSVREDVRRQLPALIAQVRRSSGKLAD
jgi:hypothetical protein